MLLFYFIFTELDTSGLDKFFEKNNTSKSKHLGN